MRTARQQHGSALGAGHQRARERGIRLLVGERIGRISHLTHYCSALRSSSSSRAFSTAAAPCGARARRARGDGGRARNARGARASLWVVLAAAVEQGRSRARRGDLLLLLFSRPVAGRRPRLAPSLRPPLRAERGRGARGATGDARATRAVVCSRRRSRAGPFARAAVVSSSLALRPSDRRSSSSSRAFSTAAAHRGVRARRAGGDGGRARDAPLCVVLAAAVEQGRSRAPRWSLLLLLFSWPDYWTWRFGAYFFLTSIAPTSRRSRRPRVDQSDWTFDLRQTTPGRCAIVVIPRRPGCGTGGASVSFGRPIGVVGAVGVVSWVWSVAHLWTRHAARGVIGRPL